MFVVCFCIHKCSRECFLCHVAHPLSAYINLSQDLHIYRYSYCLPRTPETYNLHTLL